MTGSDVFHSCLTVRLWAERRDGPLPVRQCKNSIILVSSGTAIMGWMKHLSSSEPGKMSLIRWQFQNKTKSECLASNASNHFTELLKFKDKCEDLPPAPLQATASIEQKLFQS